MCKAEWGYTALEQVFSGEMKPTMKPESQVVWPQFKFRWSSLCSFLLAMVTTTLLSCGPGVPTDEDAARAYKAGTEGMNWAAYGGKPTSFHSIRKTNGVAGEESGVKTYEYEYEVKLKCEKDWNFGYGGAEPSQCKAGELVVQRGTFRFVKTENGWQAESE